MEGMGETKLVCAGIKIAHWRAVSSLQKRKTRTTSEVEVEVEVEGEVEVEVEVAKGRNKTRKRGNKRDVTRGQGRDEGGK